MLERYSGLDWALTKRLHRGCNQAGLSTVLECFAHSSTIRGKKASYRGCQLHNAGIFLTDTTESSKEREGPDMEEQTSSSICGVLKDLNRKQITSSCYREKYTRIWWFYCSLFCQKKKKSKSIYFLDNKSTSIIVPVDNLIYQSFISLSVLCFLSLTHTLTHIFVRFCVLPTSAVYKVVKWNHSLV